MAVLSRKQMKFLDRLFYNAPALEKAVAELRAEAASAAMQSVDPTSREAVVNIMPVNYAMGYDDPEQWLQVVAMTWARFHVHTGIGAAMRKRYRKNESPELICATEHIGVNTFFVWRKEFLLFAAFSAARKNLKF